MNRNGSNRRKKEINWTKIQIYNNQTVYSYNERNNYFIYNYRSVQGKNIYVFKIFIFLIKINLIVLNKILHIVRNTLFYSNYFKIPT